MQDKHILLIISGGIAAYKSLELIRLIRKSGGRVTCILTKGGEQFVTPLSVAALSEEQVHTDLWSLRDETDMRHIRLTREADLVVIAPASADIMAKMANGLANDLASTTLLASDKPIMIAPAMNPQMWNHPATQENLKTLETRGATIIGPGCGEMACGETGDGRMLEATEIFDHINQFFFERPLKGKTAIVTAGPTYEPVDPVRFIGNRSSGKQGYAIAKALRDQGASVTLISGPSDLPAPAGITVNRVGTAAEMMKATEAALPADIAICAAAVSDWTPTNPADKKIKKDGKTSIPTIEFTETQDILKTVSNHRNRPSLVIGFAAETNDLIENAKKKIQKKNCDWIIANDVAAETIFGADENHVYLITHKGETEWPRMAKSAVATKIVEHIIETMAADKDNNKEEQSNDNTDKTSAA